MTFIYKPAGRAAEYSTFALNHYVGCPGGCLYCFGPAFCHKSPEQFHGQPYPRRHLLEGLAKELPAFTGTTDPIMLSFICDPYQDLDIGLELTRKVMTMMVDQDVPFSILTKQGDRAPRDFDLMRRAWTCKFGVTLTVRDEGERVHWEPRCGTVQDRVRAIMEAHKDGIRTWVSLEPIIHPVDTIQFLELLADTVDEFKIGKLNYHEHEKTIDWPQARTDILEAIKRLGIERKCYIKESLRNL